MPILVSDTNIFIDMDVGNLTRSMFRLEETFATPDILYREELARLRLRPTRHVFQPADFIENFQNLTQL